MEATSLKRPLVISAVFVLVMIAGIGLFVDIVFAAMIALLAGIWQIVRLLYYAVRNNGRGLKLVGARLLMWGAAMFGMMALFGHYMDRARAEGDTLVAALKTYHVREGRYPEQLEALAPRDIPVIAKVKVNPMREQPFRYRSNGKNFTLLYVTGFRMGALYDSERAKWEPLD